MKLDAQFALAESNLLEGPSNCRHVFCNYCLSKWKSQSKKCLICIKEFNNLIKVDIAAELIPFQGELFV